jgi:hypothetical protein
MILSDGSSRDNPMPVRLIRQQMSSYNAKTVSAAISRLFNYEGMGMVHRKLVKPGRERAEYHYWIEPIPHLRPGEKLALPSTPSFLLRTDKGSDYETIPMILFCPNGHRHIDEGDFEHNPHHTHACQECGIVWRPAKVNTHGVTFLPGYKNED